MSRAGERQEAQGFHFGMDDSRWDAFMELTTTMADECFPTRIPLDPHFPEEVCRNIVWWLLNDSEMRPLLEKLLEQTPLNAEIVGSNDCTNPVELLRRVVQDYAHKCCSDPNDCSCSMAQAHRFVARRLISGER